MSIYNMYNYILYIVEYYALNSGVCIVDLHIYINLQEIKNLIQHIYIYIIIIIYHIKIHKNQ